MPEVHVATPSPSLLDNDQLNDAERQFIEMFERERGGDTPDNGDVTLTSAEELAEPSGTPGSTATPVAAPESLPTVEGQSSDSVSVPSTQAPTQPPLPDPDPDTPIPEPEPEPEPSPSAFTFAGVDYSPDQLARAVQVHDWYANLQDPQIAAIDALLSGQYRLVPAHEAAPVPQTPPPAQPVIAPVSSSPPPVVDDDQGEWLDPRAQSEIARLTTELSAMREQFNGAVTPIVQSQHDLALQQKIEAISQAHVAFRDEYTLTDEQVDSVAQAVVQAGVLPSLLQRHNGDVQTATRAAYDMMFWTTPTLRDAYVRQQASTELATLSQEQQANTLKQQKMTALASSGGSVPRRELAPQNKDDRHSAMVEAIRADLNGS